MQDDGAAAGETGTPLGGSSAGVANPGSQGTISGNMDLAHLSDLLGADITTATASRLTLEGFSASLDLQGRSFIYDADDQLLDGTATYVTYQAATGGGFTAALSLGDVSAADFDRWVLTDATQEAFSRLLAFNDDLTGSGGADLIRGFAGDDDISGGGGADTLWGGTGDDTIYATGIPFAHLPFPVGDTYLRGEEGDDRIYGGDGFDDINGNQGDDTVSAGAGDDWAVGGKDNDSLSGDRGDDIVYGNLGNDTCDGGDGDDIVRGGQQNDSLTGGAGNDFISGDKGDDTVAGGSGADIFHTFGDAGVDRVLDFSVADGDRVMLDPGTQYTVAQVGADTVISMTGGAQMILVGVQMSALPQGWIFGA